MQHSIIVPEEQDFDLDLKDQKLLSAITQNSRLAPTFLGKLVNLSKDGVRYRLKKLKDSRLILGSLLVVNPFAFGYSLHMKAVQLRNLPLRDEQGIITGLVNHPSTLWVGKCLGQFSLIIFYLSKKKDEDAWMQSIFQKYLIASVNVEITSIHNYQNATPWYFQESGIGMIEVKRKDASFQKLITRPAAQKVNVEIDSLDKKILLCLSEDAGASIASIAAKVAAPFNTVKNRIARLIRQHLILSFNALLHLSSLKNIVYACSIRVSDPEKGKLCSFLKLHQNTGYLFEYDNGLVWYGAVKTNAHLYRDIEKLRLQFPAIESITIIFVVKDYKFTFTPECLLTDLASG